MPTKENIATWFQKLQDDICTQLETADGQGKFKEDLWQRAGGGGGRTRIFAGKHIEKGGVNFSAVHGALPEAAAKALKATGGDFFATGVSIVLHPQNPKVPIIHMNVRYFEMTNGEWWFGGGIDLTPHYVDSADAIFFHNTLKATCDQHEVSYYPKFKKWADDYFFIPHRNETRGIGGIFFDRLNNKSKAAIFEFVKAVGETFCKLYLPLLAKSKDKTYTDQEKQWQLLRRGRYVEFNLVWDRGTKFGLETNGRTESILMSLPPMANWQYNYQAKPDSEEAKTLGYLKKGINWESGMSDEQ